MDLGNIKSGSEVDLTCYDKENNIISSGVQIVSFDEAKFTKVFDVLNSSPLNVTDYGDGYIKGDVHC